MTTDLRDLDKYTQNAIQAIDAASKHCVETAEANGHRRARALNVEARGSTRYFWLRDRYGITVNSIDGISLEERG